MPSVTRMESSPTDPGTNFGILVLWTPPPPPLRPTDSAVPQCVEGRCYLRQYENTKEHNVSESGPFVLPSSKVGGWGKHTEMVSLDKASGVPRFHLAPGALRHNGRI